jgi:hypothetical protein
MSAISIMAVYKRSLHYNNQSDCILHCYRWQKVFSHVVPENTTRVVQNRP